MSAPAETIGDFLLSWSPTGSQFILVAFMGIVYIFGLIRLQLRSHWQAVPRAQMLYGLTAFAILIFALAGPPEAFADDMFFAHMVQHILIAMVASLLLLASKPMSAYLWTLPETIRIGLAPALARRGYIRTLNTTLTNPRVALPVFILTMWFWHIPEAYQAAIQNELIHTAMHLSMLSTAILFWWPIVGPPPVRTVLSEPQKIIYLILAVTPTAVLAAIITLSDTVIYSHYIDTIHHFTLTPAEDQRIGGLLMWIPGNIVYLATLTTLFFKWFGHEERQQRQSYRPKRRHAKATRQRIEELRQRSNRDRR